MSSLGAQPSETPSEEPVVLVADDEEKVAQGYGLWLENDYDVRVATSGEEALKKFDRDVSVLVLDRRMPGFTGDEVLAELRERGVDCRVALVTAVDPDYDVAEMEIDAYLTKPIERGDLAETVDRLVALSEYMDHFYELTSLKVRRNVLEVEKSDHELSQSEEFARLEERISSLEKTLQSIRQQVDIDGRGPV